MTDGSARNSQGVWDNQLNEWIQLGIVAAIPAVTAGIAYAKGWPMTGPILVGFAVFVGVVIAAAQYRVYKAARRDAPVTVDNIETKLRAWADVFRWTIQRLDIPDTFFAYTISTNASNKTVVVRSKTLPNYLMITRSLSLSGDHKRTFEGLTEPTKQRLYSMVRLELAKTSVEFEQIALPERVAMRRTLPITHELSEYGFTEAMLDCDQAWIVAREVVVTFLGDQARAQSVE